MDLPAQSMPPSSTERQPQHSDILDNLSKPQVDAPQPNLSDHDFTKGIFRSDERNNHSPNWSRHSSGARSGGRHRVLEKQH